ncbi:hypothetical protein BC830DRAFT_1174180 [Chytriomyces sp. MP71]|nr:hypothetical protein BC830DRAFT_1174180 [Chytriomyces sp. MP71]
MPDEMASLAQLGARVEDQRQVCLDLQAKIDACTDIDEIQALGKTLAAADVQHKTLAEEFEARLAGMPIPFNPDLHYDSHARLAAPGVVRRATNHSKSHPTIPGDKIYPVFYRVLRKAQGGLSVKNICTGCVELVGPSSTVPPDLLDFKEAVLCAQSAKLGTFTDEDLVVFKSTRHLEMSVPLESNVLVSGLGVTAEEPAVVLVPKMRKEFFYEQ